MLISQCPQVKKARSEIENSIIFFSRTPYFAFEYEALLSSPKTDFKRSILSDRSLNKYTNIKPKYLPANDSIANIFRCKEKIDIRKISIPKLELKINKTYFIYLKDPTSKKGRHWLIKTDSDFLMINISNGNIEAFSSDKITIESKQVIIQLKNNGLKYPVTTYDKLDSKEIITELLVDLMNSISQKKSCKSYEWLACSILAIGACPPINNLTISYYRSLFENFAFLFFIAKMHHNSNEPEENCNAWMSIAAHQIGFLIPLLVYDQFRHTENETMILRDNTFISFLLTQLLLNDEEFVQFIDTFNPSPENTVVDFLDKLEAIKFNQQTHFIMNNIMKQAKICFPNTLAHYYGVSGIMFLRILSTRVLERNFQLGSLIQVLNKFYNLQVEEGNNSKERFMKWIDQFSTFDEPYMVRQSGMSKMKDIEILVKKIEDGASSLSKVIKEIDLGSIIERFKADNKSEKIEIDNESNDQSANTET